MRLFQGRFAQNGFNSVSSSNILVIEHIFWYLISFSHKYNILSAFYSMYLIYAFVVIYQVISFYVRSRARARTYELDISPFMAEIF